MSGQEPIIQFRDLHVSFGSKIVLSGINLEIYKNETVALIGASGSGKSVLFRSIIGLEQPTRGEILVHGSNVVGKSEDEFLPIRKKVAYAFQFGALFDSFTVYDNLAYPLREHTALTETEIQSKVLKTLKIVGLEGSEFLMPASLSGGMQKRVGLARSIIMNPEVILYDEPTSGLDPFNTHNINELIIQLKKLGNTGIMITHDMKSAFYCADRIAMLFEGKIAVIGTTEEIKNSDNEIVKGFITGKPPKGYDL
jgi:phospholipid/cholesterol/gamma-HCH transport system ATP-binding protein